jgi:hypothetical protein
MGKLIATTQATVDGVIDPVGEWVQADGDHGDYSFERQERSSGLVLGRKTYEGLAGYWPSQSGNLVNATGDIVDQVQVNEEGGFVLNVSPGSWKVRGYDPQGQRGETTVSITQDDVAVQLSLTSTQA